MTLFVAKKTSRLRRAIAWILLIGLSSLLFAMLRWPSVRYGIARRIQFFSRHTVSSRVKSIWEAKPSLVPLVASSGGRMDILVFKRERRVELHAPGWNQPFVYPMAGFSGMLGPKLQEGDGQIPEGVYAIESLNPNSAFHLSLKIGYPNETDRKHANEDGRTTLGGDIFLHGGSASIGCIPVGDDAVEDIFFLVAEIGRENVRAVIAPYDMRTGRDATFERAFSTAFFGLSPQQTIPEWYAELLDEIEEKLK